MDTSILGLVVGGALSPLLWDETAAIKRRSAAAILALVAVGFYLSYQRGLMNLASVLFGLFFSMSIIGAVGAALKARQRLGACLIIGFFALGPVCHAVDQVYTKFAPPAHVLTHPAPLPQGVPQEPDTAPNS